MGPLLTLQLTKAWHAALAAGRGRVIASVDLGVSVAEIGLEAEGFRHDGNRYPWPVGLRERTIYHWDGAGFSPVSRFTRSLVKLVPTGWGPPTFEIDGIKMLPCARVCPTEDARHKVGLVEPRGKNVLDTCGGLGYFAVACLALGARAVRSYEANPDVVWLRGLNPWSPAPDPALTLVEADVTFAIAALAARTFDAILHDPPRFAIAGHLYGQEFYAELARVLRRGGRLFHYTGAPNRISRGRDLPGEVIRRLARVGFRAERSGDGVLATLG